MCAPSDLKQRVDHSDFERFEIGGALIHVQRALLSDGIIEFSIPGEGTFSIRVERRAD